MSSSFTHLSDLSACDSEKLYRAVVDSQIDLVCLYTPDTILRFVNDAYCRFFGKTREELIGQSFMPLAQRENHAAILNRIQKILRDPAPEVAVSNGLMANGQERWVEWVDHGIVDEDGKVIMIQAVGRDITAYKKMELELQQREAAYYSLFQSSPMPMWISSSETFCFLDVNEAAVRSYGYTREEFLNMTIKDIRPPEDVPVLFQNISKAPPGLFGPIIFRHCKKDGTIIDVEITSGELMFEGQPARWAMGIDVSDRQRLEEQRIYSRSLEIELAKEREIAELRTRFVSMLSHEFRTPLAVIQSSIDLIRNYYDRLSEQQVFERIGNVANQVGQMVELLEDVLLIGQGNANKLEVRFEKLDLRILCETIVDNLRLTDQAQHRFVFDYENTCGDVLLDERLMKHILVNLLTNAVKYSPKGGEITLRVRRHDATLVIHVQDEGIGIPYADQSRLFEPFVRAGNATAFQGTGLGLAIVKQSVEAHGGKITLDSAENAGTTFTIELPLKGE